MSIVPGHGHSPSLSESVDRRRLPAVRCLLAIGLFLGLVWPRLPAGAASADAGAPAAPGSFAYLLQAEGLFQTKAAAATALARCERDWLVLDGSFSEGEPWQRADLEAIRRGRPGRQIVAYLSIGEAEDYRPYWHPEWGRHGRLTPVAPKWLGAENPEWKGNYRVQYWHPAWQALILAAVDDLMARGFDGVYLDIVDGFQTFEQNGRDSVVDRPNPVTRQSYRRDMVDWVKAIAARARSKNPAALIIPQNGSQLLAHEDFHAAISGLGLEDLWTNGNKLQDKDDTAEVLGFIAKLAGTGKPVLLIEYPTSPERQALIKKLALLHAMTWLITDRPLKTLGISGR